MSWRQAQGVAERIYSELRAQHTPGFIRMVLRALERLLNEEERKRKP